jgi:hypothetical protein
LESSSSSSSSFTADSLSRFFGLGEEDGGLFNFRASREALNVEDGTGACPLEFADGRSDDRSLLVIGFSGFGEAGPTPLGSPLCFARSAKARFMVNLINNEESRESLISLRLAR